MANACNLKAQPQLSETKVRQQAIRGKWHLNNKYTQEGNTHTHTHTHTKQSSEYVHIQIKRQKAAGAGDAKTERI